jgi:GNAT superfamily N-acetyltransferase
MLDITIETLKPEYADELAELQKITLPTLNEVDWLKKEHFLKHCELFPEGNFVAVCDGKLVGLGSGFLTDFNFEAPYHTFLEITAEGYQTNHDPNGAWYYGTDITVHPEYRRRGIGGMLYAARKGIIQRLNRRGLIAGGLVPGFAKYKHLMNIRTYVVKVIAGEIHDSTLSFQLNQGFQVHDLLDNYLDDEPSDNWAALIVWNNPHYEPAGFLAKSG